MNSIKMNFGEAIKPYIREKIEMQIADYRVKAEERLRILFDSLVDDFTEEIVNAISKKVNKKIKK